MSQIQNTVKAVVLAVNQFPVAEPKRDSAVPADTLQANADNSQRNTSHVERLRVLIHVLPLRESHDPSCHIEQ